jgi:hypothetical protein
LRDTAPVFGGLYTGFNALRFYDKNGMAVHGNFDDPAQLMRSNLVNDWNPDTNATAYTARGDLITASILFKCRFMNETIGQAWDNKHLTFITSYNVDWTSTSMNVWTIVGIIIGFTPISSGITGIFGTIMDGSLFFILWGVRLFLIIKFTLAIIPFIPGLHGD